MSEAAASAPAEIVVLGKIVAPYGLAGAVKVFPFADDPRAWAKLPCWWLGKEGQPPECWRKADLRRCRLQNDLLVADLACLLDRNDAEAAKGLLVGVPREALPPAADGEYYWADLIGLEVFNVQAESLGRVSGLIETPANPVLQVIAQDERERLIPFVAAVVLDVDLPARRIQVDWGADW